MIKPVGAQRGFTLLEVLVAFTIAASAVLTVLYSFSEGLWRLQRTTDYAIAALVAESRLAELGVVYPVTPGEVEGSSENENYHWVVTIDPYSDALVDFPTVGFALFDITVRVRWQQANQQRQFTLYSQKTASLDD